ncbi:NUDIX hydrolase [Candidatus Wolfebacteria bacterium]|nr:MAG: NUDIX hydrolase [Candidatus Wolfebacteria bacterium]
MSKKRNVMEKTHSKAKGWVPPEEYYAALPKFVLGSSVIFFNESGEILLLKTTYKEGWTVPGGTVDANESPRDAAVREVQEEIGLQKGMLSLLSIDSAINFFGERGTQFTFLGGTLSNKEIEKIIIQEEEISEYRFVSTDEAVRLLNIRFAARLPHVLKAIKENTTVYLEHGKPLTTFSKKW